MQKIYFGMGCFWKPEEQFKNIKGILETEVGYAGGYKSKVTYEEVCHGNTGHAEVVKLTFDENIISFENILELFFKFHDPTQKDMQFPDVGTQYRSEIFYEDDKQKDLAKKTKISLIKFIITKLKLIFLQLKTTVKLRSIIKNISRKNQR